MKKVLLYLTRGFLTEYASILSEESSKNGCNIAILTDLDASGVLSANTIPDIFRIGIDFDMLDYFVLDRSIVEEKYNPMSNHLKPLKALVARSSHDHNLLPENILGLLDKLTDYANSLSKKVDCLTESFLD